MEFPLFISHLVRKGVVKGHGLAADAVGAELLEHHLLRVVDCGGVAVCLNPVLLSKLLDDSQHLFGCTSSSSRRAARHGIPGVLLLEKVLVPVLDNGHLG